MVNAATRSHKGFVGKFNRLPLVNENFRMESTHKQDCARLANIPLKFTNAVGHGNR